MDLARRESLAPNRVNERTKSNKFIGGSSAAISKMACVDYNGHRSHVLPSTRFSPDRVALRFFWWIEGNLDFKPSIYRMTVHLFGAQSSPSCSTFCLCETGKFGRHFDSDVVETVMKSFYVDDCLTGTNTEEAAIKIISDLRSLLVMDEFKLTKWFSSSNKIIQTVPEEEILKSLQNSMRSNAPRERVLRINWDVSSDQFFFKVDLLDAPTTNQGILAVTNSLCSMIFWGLCH